jgi:hypothetical protein
VFTGHKWYCADAVNRRPFATSAASPRATIILGLVFVATLLPSAMIAAEEQALETVASPVPTEVSPSPGTDGPAVSAEPPAPLPEPDFRVGEWELQDVPWEERRLAGGPPMTPRTVGDADEKGVPLRPLGRGGALVYNPTVLAQQGIKRLDSYQQTGKDVHRRVARNIAAVLDKTATDGKGRRWQPHSYALGLQKPGWVNGNSHGLVLSFMSRYYELLGAEAKLESARELLPAFDRREGSKRWFTTVTDDGLLWFEHWPDGKHVHTLNAHLNTLFGLYDYWLLTGDPVAERYFLGGALTVREKLDRFRRKDRLSRYSLSAPLATVHYHETHIDQLQILSRMTGDEWFARQADKLARDQRKWLADSRGRG